MRVSQRAVTFLAVYAAIVGTVALILIAWVIPKLTFTLNRLADLLDKMSQ